MKTQTQESITTIRDLNAGDVFKIRFNSVMYQVHSSDLLGINVQDCGTGLNYRWGFDLDFLEIETFIQFL